jgi:hypothetical protein
VQRQDAGLALHLDHREERGQADLREVALERRPEDGLSGLLRQHLGAAHGLGDPQIELLEAERLGHVVVGAQAKAADAILVGRQRGQEDHRQGRQLGAGAQRLDQRPAIHLRHHHVGDQQVGRRHQGPGQRVLAVGRREDGVAAFLEDGRDHPKDPRIVVGDENHGRHDR